MGTHPIFESDFDCLTECHLWKNGSRKISTPRLVIRSAMLSKWLLGLQKMRSLLKNASISFKNLISVWTILSRMSFITEYMVLLKLRNPRARNVPKRPQRSRHQRHSMNYKDIREHPEQSKKKLMTDRTRTSGSAKNASAWPINLKRKNLKSG